MMTWTDEDLMSLVYHACSDKIKRIQQFKHVILMIFFFKNLEKCDIL